MAAVFLARVAAALAATISAAWNSPRGLEPAGREMNSRCGKRHIHHRAGRRHGTVPPLRLRLATSFWRRAAGFFLYSALPAHEGLWLKPCRAIHTVGMGRSIDVVFLDRQGRVLKAVHALRPNRAAWCLKAHSVIELPAFYCRRHGHYRAALLRALCSPSRKGPPLIE